MVSWSLSLGGKVEEEYNIGQWAFLAWKKSCRLDRGIVKVLDC